MLRIHRDAYHSELAIASELQWMSALGVSGLNVPELILTKEQKLGLMPFEEHTSLFL